MLSKRILLAIEELEMWKKRENEFKNLLEKATGEERTRLKKELEKVSEQVDYYEALIGDMKKELRPIKITDVLR
ncbi:MAG: hypothetical protein QMD21_01475 [Candidatus Thermoplasmatota archaeon]|nr:hypothetical protein [Candidatus Thermoplasmatota archaeon]